MSAESSDLAFARELIHRQEWEAARRALLRVRDQRADEWLARLNRQHPPKRRGNPVLVALLAGAILSALVVFTAVDYQQRLEKSTLYACARAANTSAEMFDCFH